MAQLPFATPSRERRPPLQQTPEAVALPPLPNPAERECGTEPQSEGTCKYIVSRTFIELPREDSPASRKPPRKSWPQDSKPRQSELLVPTPLRQLRAAFSGQQSEDNSSVSPEARPSVAPVAPRQGRWVWVTEENVCNYQDAAAADRNFSYCRTCRLTWKVPEPFGGVCTICGEAVTGGCLPDDGRLPAEGQIVSRWVYEVPGALRYYDIVQSDGKFIFEQNACSGELVQENDWYIADLTDADGNKCGKIRVKLIDGQMQSNFQGAGDDKWDITILARKELRISEYELLDPGSASSAAPPPAPRPLKLHGTV